MNWGMNLGWVEEWGLVGESRGVEKRTYMMRKIRIHDDNKVTSDKVKAMDIRRPIHNQRSSVLLLFLS